MKNKRTILAFILAIVFLVPSVLFFSGCSFGKKESKEADKYIEIAIPSLFDYSDAQYADGWSQAIEKEVGKTYYFSFTKKFDMGTLYKIQISLYDFGYRYVETANDIYARRKFSAGDYTLKLLDENKKDVTSVLSYSEENHEYYVDNYRMGEKYYLEITLNRADATGSEPSENYDFLRCCIHYGIV